MKIKEIMTLIAELAAPDSPASRFLREYLPERARLVAMWANQISHTPPVVMLCGRQGEDCCQDQIRPRWSWMRQCGEC
ncbi:hypothetical protein ACQP2P_11485 [Dactylosporangium sp. CA-139114]|uniref:hypothetical protein n=1 Tax=Dactylosporangium sp. CA-139114 TaxID=3239931 RepID=UPI003D982CB9